MNKNDIEMIDTILRHGEPETALSRANDYMRGKALDEKDFQIILGRVDLFLHKEIQRSRKRNLLGKISVAVSCLALGLAILAIVIRIC